MEPSCRMGGLLELSESKSYEDLKKSDQHKHSDNPEKYYRANNVHTKNFTMKEDQINSKKAKVEEMFEKLGDNTQINALMTSSVASMSESTPTDSGIQMLDSEMSEMSVSGFESDAKIMEQSLEDVISITKHELTPEQNELVMTNSDIVNSNVTPKDQKHIENLDDENSAKAKPEEFKEIDIQDTKTEDTENIVYRRRIKKKITTAPKKRVSFHEDILKNTKTDNIHIERGFITYKPNLSDNNSRYSWCSEGDQPYGNRRRNILQRNACSDVIDYGNTEVTATLCFDNSGIFEYAHKNKDESDDKPKQESNNENEEGKLYICSCSGSDNSLTESDDSGKNYDKNQKSASCDCIGSKDFQENIENGNYYYSEPNIGSNEKELNYASMWSKEKKPKSSCLKKTTTITQDVLSEQVRYNDIKNYNMHKKTEGYLTDTKNIFGSLKNIYKQMSFGLTLAERGVPEGSEDISSVIECVPENDNSTKPKSFLSKSFDAGFCVKNDEDEFYPNKTRTTGDGHSRNYIHDVDSQLRRKNSDDIFGDNNRDKKTDRRDSDVMTKSDVYRNKFIVNCESTVFEHTGVSYGYEYQNFIPKQESSPKVPEQQNSIKDAHMPLKEKLSRILKGLTDMRENPTSNQQYLPSFSQKTTFDRTGYKKYSLTSSDFTSDTESVTASEFSDIQKSEKMNGSFTSESSRASKHLASPLRQKSSVPRYEKIGQSPKRVPKINVTLPQEQDEMMSIDIIDEDDNLTVESGIENFEQLVKYTSTQSLNTSLRPSSSKTSLINRFLRNITQKKILDSKLHNNDFYLNKVKSEKKILKNLYVKSAVPKKELSDDLDEQIRKEMQENSPVKKRVMVKNKLGEVEAECYKSYNTDHFRDKNEILQKVYNVYSAYDSSGTMIPYTVFLTNKTLYVCVLLTNKSYKYCNRFVLPYEELDVVLVGPRGQTLLLSNKDRDMQICLCPGGATLAGALAAGVERCAGTVAGAGPGWGAASSSPRRRTDPPAFGVLAVSHLDGLQRFVCDNSAVENIEPWHFYSVVHTKDLASELSADTPMSGYLMYRLLKNSRQNIQWQAGYFMLKAGVLYQFTDASDKLPCDATPLSQRGECVGAHRVPPPCRPYAFELLLDAGRRLQLAASDEYVASDWLQALVQAASGMYVFPETRPATASTLILTSKHIVLVREDFENLLPIKETQYNQTAAHTNTKRLPIKPILSESIISERIDYNKSDDMSITSDQSDSSWRRIKNIHRESILASCTGGEGTSKRNSIVGSDCSNTRSPHTSPEHSRANVRQRRTEFGKGVKVLTCDAIADVVSLKIPTNEDKCCVLEFACHEVQESSGDMVLFFSTGTDLDKFISTIEVLWSYNNCEESPFPLSTLDLNNPVNSYYGDTFAIPAHTWSPANSMLSSNLKLSRK